MLAIALCSAAGHAEPQHAPAASSAIRVTYDAPPECPGSQAFVREVLARTQRARLASASEPGSTFHVRVRSSAGRHAGTLIVVRSPEGSAERHISGDSCGEVVSALALIAALTIDPDATTAPLPARPPESQPRAAPVDPAPVPALAVPAERHRPNQAARRLDAPPVRSEPRPALWSFAATMAAEVAFTMAPAPTPAPRWGLELAHASGPALKLSGTRVVHGGDDLELTWTVARLEACPAALGARFKFRPCAAFDAGELAAAGVRSPQREPLAASRPWFAVSALARVNVALVGPLELHGEAGVAVPLVRDSFVVESPGAGETSALVHEIPAFSGFVGLGLSVRFWL